MYVSFYASTCITLFNHGIHDDYVITIVVRGNIHVPVHFIITIKTHNSTLMNWQAGIFCILNKNVSWSDKHIC